MRDLPRHLGIGAGQLVLWVRLSFAAAPVLCTVRLVLRVAGAVLAPVATAGAGAVVGGLLGADPARVRAGVVLVGLGIVVATIDAATFNLLGLWTADGGVRYVRHRVLQMMSDISSVAHHEDPSTADRVALLRDDARVLGSGSERLGSSVAAVAATVSVVVVLATQAWWLVALVPLAVVAAIATSWAVRLRAEATEQNAQARRLADGMLTLAGGADHGAEIRCSGTAPVILDLVESALLEREHAVDRIRRRTGPVLLVLRLVNVAAVVASFVLLFVLARQGRVETSALVVVVLLVPQLADIGEQLQRVASDLSDAQLRLGRFQWLERYAVEHTWSASGEPPVTLADGIRLSGVGFTYPQATEPALAEVSLDLTAGSVVAVVGENGAGKSTLVKLLARLYDPAVGEISVDGANLRTVDADAWRSRVSAVVQDHQRFSFLVRETIGIAGLDAAEEIPADDELAAAVDRSRATAVVAGLDRGLDTQLGGSFADGVSLSGGQWQRLAIARGFVRTEPLLMLLDEPSSALDPEAEHQILTGYLDQARRVARRTGGITVIISHRLSTVRDADQIMFLADGRLIESGSHAELVRARGHYAEMFELQARAYRS